MSDRGKNESQSEDRKLQIKIAQLNAYLQVYLALIFGEIAGGITILVFGYQLILDGYPQFSIKTLFAIVFFIVATFLLMGAARVIPKLKECMNGFKSLQL
jgi:hypothetical protein